MYTYSGRLVVPERGAPALEDIAVGLGRICRFGGQCGQFYPVLLHSFVVADLLPDALRVYGLLHDAAEVLIGDIPRPMKLAPMKRLELHLQARILHSLGLVWPTRDQIAALKRADNRALGAEIRSIHNLKLGRFRDFRKPDDQADTVLASYLRRYKPKDCIHADGIAVRDFLTQTKQALRRLRCS